MPTIGQAVSWPGAGAIESFAYSAGHGISPGVATVVTLPRANEKPPAEFGDLVWGDGLRVVRLRDCKVDALSPVRDSTGLSWTLTIFDRRWRWRTPQASFGKVSGRYNLPDDHGKMVPWTLRKPVELARLCLKAMGESRYEIDLPDGLGQLTGNQYQDFLRLGQNFPQSKANPTVQWDYTPPAEALARLCDIFGRRVVYQPVSDKVLIAKLGEGKSLPTGPYESIGATIDAPEKPSRIGVAGSPIRFQFRLPMEAVGEEWNRAIVPIDDLTYRPDGRTLGGAKQIVTFTWDGDAGVDGAVEVTITVNLFGVPGATVTYTFRASAGSTPLADNVTEVVGKINANPDVAKVLVASSSGETLILTGREDGYAWGSAEITDPLIPDNANWSGVSQLPEYGQRVGGWEYCGPPNYTAAKATDRLAFDQARELARKSVYVYYRVLNLDPERRQGPLDIPGFGKVTRRHQIVLLPGKVDQVVPEARDPRGGNKGRPGVNRDSGVLADLYDGYSRDQGPDVYGSVSRLIGSVLWSDGAKGNTLPPDKVRVPFSVVPERHLIAFAAPVYARPLVGPIGERYAAPALLLETAFYLMDASTSALVRPEYTRELGGAGGEEWIVRDDIEVSYVGRYDETSPGKLLEYERDERDAAERVQYYLDALAAKYELKGGEVRRYIGCYPIDPDGLVQQVSWSIGGGATTTASTNTEHNADVPPYPARRRNENLPPNTQAALANLVETQRVQKSIGIAILGRVAGGIAGMPTEG